MHIHLKREEVLVVLLLLLLYTNKDINNNSDGTNEFISFYLQSLVTRGEREIIKAYANHTMLTPRSTRGTSCGV